MSNQDIPHYFGSFLSPDFPDNDFFSDIPSVEPLNSLLIHNVFGHTGRSVIHSSIQSHPGLGRGRIPVLNPFLNRPIIDIPQFFDPQQQQQQQQQQHPFPARIVGHVERIRTQVPIPPALAVPSLPVPQPTTNGRNRKRRASEKAISELKHMRLIDLKEDDDCCIICMEAFVDIKSSTDEPKRENALQMPCGHIFGSHCLKLWLKDHSTCPTCRKEVDFVEEDERGERGERAAMAMHRRRLGGMERDMRQAAGIASRHRHMQQQARDQAAVMQNRLVEVEVIVQRQRYTAPHMDPAAREHDAEDAGWMSAGPHAPLQQFSHYPQYLGIGAFQNPRVGEPIDNGHDSSARLPEVPAVQALPRPQNYNHPLGIVNRTGPPQAMFGPGAVHTFQQRHHQHQSPNMPQRSQSQRQLQRQSQYQPYPEVNMANRGPVTSNTGSIDQGMYSQELGSRPNGSPRVATRGYTPPSSVNTQHNSQGAHQNQHLAPNHYLAGGINLYPWDSNVRLQQQQHQQPQQTFIDPASSQMLNIQLSSSRRVCPATAASSPPQHLQGQCDYTDMSMCQHQFSNNPNFSAGNIAVLPPDQTQIVQLSCGHGFHRACLLSTMKSSTSRAVRPAKWLCGKCGRYEDEMGIMEGRQQTVGQAQQTTGQ